MASNDLVSKKENGVVTITLNRPGQLNALNKEIFDGLKSLLDVLETDKTVRGIIFVGSGDKAFCVGADLKERQGMNEKDVLLRMDFVHKLYLRIERFGAPVIAAMNGLALGGGLELALACDMRILAEGATVGCPEVDLAIIPGNGGTQRLARVVGVAKALELVLLAKKIPAKDALPLGLVNAVVASEKVYETAQQWMIKMGEAGPIGLKQAKHAIRTGVEKPLEEALRVELEAYKACLYSKDRLEGLKAFSEKRKPIYTGA